MGFLKTVEIGGRSVGTACPAYIIAEVGINHNGSLDLAIESVDAAHEAGADAVKLQIFRAETFVHPEAPHFAFTQSCELSRDAFETLFDHARKKNITVFATPESLDDIDFIHTLSPPAIKIASMDLNYRAFVQRAAQLAVPVILSTGMGYHQEVEAAVDWIRTVGNDNLVLLHCVSCYPAAPEEINLSAIRALSSRFDVPVGYSDHAEGIHIAFAAVASGASVIEKHFTLDKSLPGPDHKGSADPQDLARLVRQVRSYELAVGSEARELSSCEQEARLRKRRSIYAARSLQQGETLQLADVKLLTPSLPESQLEHLDALLGKTVQRPIRAGELVSKVLFKK